MIFKKSGDPTEVAVVDYTNHIGVREMRTITPISIEWTHTVYHPEPGWILLCWCHRAKAQRAFAMKDIHDWKSQ